MIDFQNYDNEFKKLKQIIINVRKPSISNDYEIFSQ